MQRDNTDLARQRLSNLHIHEKSIQMSPKQLRLEIQVFGNRVGFSEGKGEGTVYLMRCRLNHHQDFLIRSCSMSSIVLAGKSGRRCKLDFMMLLFLRELVSANEKQNRFAERRGSPPRM